MLTLIDRYDKIKTMAISRIILPVGKAQQTIGNNTTQRMCRINENGEHIPLVSLRYK